MDPRSRWLAVAASLDLTCNFAVAQALATEPSLSSRAVSSSQQGEELGRIVVTGYIIPRIGEGVSLKSSYFNTEEGAQDILFRMRDDHDGAEPSANSVAAMNLTWLARILNVKEFQLAAARLIGSFHPVLQRVPAALPQMLAAIDATITEPIQIVIAKAREPVRPNY